MQFQVNSVDVKHFTITNKLKTFVAEASDLHGYELLQRLDLRGQQGFAMHNTHTGSSTRWAHARTPKDRDGDVMCWIYEPTAETLQQHPNLKDWQVHVLND